MSHVTRSPLPVLLATAAAADTPAAGPDSASPIGSRRASSTEIEPPAECTSRSGARKPLAARSAASVSMPLKAPCVYALSTANVVRSNSRIAGWSAAPEIAGMSGSASLIAAIACCSWSGLRNDQRNETASASTPFSSTSRRAAATTSAGSSARITLPSRSMRSLIPTVQRGETTSGGGVSQPSSSCTRRGGRCATRARWSPRSSRVRSAARPEGAT